MPNCKHCQVSHLESLRPVRLRCVCFAAPHGSTTTPVSHLESLRPVRLRCVCFAAPHGSTTTPSTPPDHRLREAGG